MPRRLSAGKTPARVFGRIEEMVLAASGADAFELVFALAVARLFARAKGRKLAATKGRALRAEIRALLDGAAKRWPGLAPTRDLAVPDDALAAVLGLLDRAALDGDAEGLDALFEQLVTRVGKGQKGQFFTPRHVVDFAVRALALEGAERFLDPACGSGAFVAHARAAARVDAWGYDVDARAVRVAKLLAVATGGDPGRLVRKDSLAALRGADGARFDAIATNPPFAGAPDARGFEVAELGGRVERDALFLERCLSFLKPGGRLAIVLPHGKVASPACAGLRRWLVGRARVLAVVSLPGETFLPHTSQRAVLLFAQKRKARAERAAPGERVVLAVSERGSRDFARWREHDHDLAELEAPLFRFLRAERIAG